MTPKDKFAREYNKCSHDFIYYANKYMNIYGDGTELFPFQCAIIDSIKDNKINIITKSRQMGITKLFLSYALWLIIFRKDISIKFIFFNATTLRLYRDWIRNLYDSIPNDMKTDISIDNKTLIKLKNSSEIHFSTPMPDTFRGYTLDYIFFDEAQFIKDFENLWYSGLPCLIRGDSKVVAYSTLSQDKTFFKDIYYYSDVVDGDSVNKFKVTWYQYPGHDDYWYKKYVNILGKKTADYEMNIVG